MRLLLVEDKKELCDSLEKLFKANNIDLDICYDGEDGLLHALSNDYAVIILDIMLPVMSGVDVLKHLRVRSLSTPVIMLTARDALDDKVSAFDYGADDYVIKPFEFKELLARVRALIRRPNLLHESIVFGNTSVNPKNYEVTISGKPIKTSIKEAKTLERLFAQAGNYVSKESILLVLCGSSGDIASNNVEVYIHHLRKKLPPELSGFRIETKQNVGYRVVGE